MQPTELNGNRLKIAVCRQTSDRFIQAELISLLPKLVLAHALFRTNVGETFAIISVFEVLSSIIGSGLKSDSGLNLSGLTLLLRLQSDSNDHLNLVLRFAVQCMTFTMLVYSPT